MKPNVRIEWNEEEGVAKLIVGLKDGSELVHCLTTREARGLESDLVPVMRCVREQAEME